MAINVKASPSVTNVTVIDGNNIKASISNGNNINLTVIPTPKQIVQINRGVQGQSGGDFIGGYPVVVSGVANYDALMFLNNQWTNIPQTEIADGGNF